MKKELEKFQFMSADDISDENVDFHSLQEQELDADEEEVLECIEEPKNSESFASVNADDNVKIYLHQIGKIPLLSAEDELKLAQKILKICL